MKSPSMADRLARAIAAVGRRGVAELLYAAGWKAGARFRAPTVVQRALFTRIYDRNEWGCSESRSGPGSTRARGSDIAQSLLRLFDTLGIKMLLDAPCGDFNWMCHLTGTLQSYVGVDIVRELIERNQEQYASDKRAFICRDIARDALPSADAILCRDALVHLSYADIRAVLTNFKRTGAKYLIATTFAATSRNDDVRTGGWRALNMQIAPFHFPEPIVNIRDVSLVSPGSHPDKLLAVWQLHALSPAPGERRAEATDAS